MKRTLSLLILIAMVLTLAACNNQGPQLTYPSTISITTPTPTGPLYDRSSYTVDLDQILANFDTVVVELGEIKVDVELLQMAYWTEFISFLSRNANDLDIFKLDLSLPLGQQVNPGMGGTWQQTFLGRALDTLHGFMAMINAAQQEGLSLPDSYLEILDTEIEDLKKAAEDAEYTDMDAYVTYLYGPGCTMNALWEYNYLSLYSSYYYDVCCGRMDITDEMIEQYYAEHEQDFINASIIKDDRIVYQVRHILIYVEEGSDENTWEEARVKAQGLLDQYLAGEQTQDAFGALATEHSDDGETYINGGFVNGLVPNSTYPTNFKEWYLDANRQIGDTALIKTELGYHVMYYCGTEAAWHYECGLSLANTMVAEIVPNAVSKFPITIHYSLLMVAEPEQDS